jgi:hypothetical protein
MHLRERQKHFTPREWVVLSSQPADLSRTQRGIVEQMDGPPAEIVAKLELKPVVLATSTSTET